MMTVAKFCGSDEAISQFVRDLHESGGDLRLLTYRAVFNLWHPPTSEDLEKARVIVGDALPVDLAQDLQVESDESVATATLRMVNEVSLLRDAICIGALYKFEVTTTLVDQEAGWGEKISLDL